MRPNIVCVVLDAARRDAFEPYGAPPGSTPAVAQLAARGAALQDVYAAGCWTVPSHAAMFTGLLPRAAGLARAPGGQPHGCRPVLELQADRLLTNVLRSAGYETAAISANLWIAESSGFAIGFERFRSIDSGRQGNLHKNDIRSRARWLIEAARSRVDDGAREAADIVDEWLSKPPSRPFFWFVNLVDCHSPYLPPRPYDDLPLHQRLRAASEARRYLTMDASWRAVTGTLEIPAEALERMRRLYRRSVTYLDAWVARLLEALDGAGVLDETLVIVTADHGENLGEEGLLAHVMSLDQRLLHVPFVAAGPGAPGDDGVLSLAALPRTIALAAGLEDHPWADDELPEGVAVSQCDPVVLADDARASEATSQWGLAPDALARLTTPLTAVTDGRLKLVRTGDRDALYDLTTGAAVPITESAEHLLAALEHPAALARREPTAPVPASAPAAAEVAELEERMRLLGYM